MSVADENVLRARGLYESCVLCPRLCRVDRAAGETGYCGMTARPVVASAGPHFGEEAPLVGRGGSGTIFLAGCNLLCIFCQNADISHGRSGETTDPGGLARVMRRLEARGCENVNFVTPTHFMPDVLEALAVARNEGFGAPVVYNTGGYERVECLRLLEGAVDVYMPDLKFLDAEFARRVSDAPDYPEFAAAAVLEMHRQVGDLEISDGVATRGLLVRHLVMPGCVHDSRAVIDFLADCVSPKTYVNVMAQYRPLFRAAEVPEIDRYPEPAEIREAKRYALERGLRLDEQ
jgi:putative pyruvate formate lyase activating enzyme